MSKRYTEMTDTEKAGLDDAEFEFSVRLEAAKRGIELPITLDEALRRKAYVGYTIPADHASFYEICKPNRYSGSAPEPTGMCFATEAAALAACVGAYAMHEDGYGPTRKNVVVSGDFTVSKRFVTSRLSVTLQEHIKELSQDTAAFEELVSECAKDCSEVRQKTYDREVQLRRRQTYMDLAKGDEEIAKGFWASTYPGAEWPEPGPVAVPAE